MSELRMQKINSLLSEEIANIIPHLKDPRLGFISLTEVLVSNDLKHAKVFISTFGNEKEKENSVKALNNAKNFIRNSLKKKVTLKYIPELLFFNDNSIERGTRIVNIINSLDIKKDE